MVSGAVLLRDARDWWVKPARQAGGVVTGGAAAAAPSDLCQLRSMVS
jgi:hypothetical protein